LETAAVSTERRIVEDAAAEEGRFLRALETAGRQLDGLTALAEDRLGKENAAVFRMHRMLLEDTEYTDPIVEIIREERVCAEYAVGEVGFRLAAVFVGMEDEDLRSRGSDVRDVSDRLLGILADVSQGPEAAGGGADILVADDFSPSRTALLDRSKVRALLCRQGSAGSHMAIFARTMGIPAIVALGPSLDSGFEGRAAMLDGGTGTLYVEPDLPTRQILHVKSEKQRSESRNLEAFRGKPTLTASGRRIKLYANIGSAADASAALAADAEGVGLFRSEFLYLGREDFPDEQTQYESYAAVLDLMGDRPVIIRTLDIGADKRLPYMDLPPEENPALGMRAIRLCLTRPEIFRTQLRAIFRASVVGNASLMFPMISSPEELARAKAAVRDVCRELAEEGIPFKEIPLGIMVETPAAALLGDILAREVDFFSIGTNDLAQYVLAVDRQNESLAEFSPPAHEAVLRLIRLTVENAHKAGIWCGICGNLAGDLSLTATFMEMGVDELSVEPSMILKVRAAIANTEG